MAISYRATPASATFSNTNAISFAKQTGTVSGDVVYLWVWNPSGNLTATCTGFTAVNGNHGNLLYRTCDGTEAGTFTVTLSGSISGTGGGYIVTLAGAQTDAHSAVDYSASISSVFSVDDVARATSSDWALIFVGVSFNSSLNETMTPPSGFSQKASVSAGGNRVVYVFENESIASGAASGTRDFTTGAGSNASGAMVTAQPQSVSVTVSGAAGTVTTGPNAGIVAQVIPGPAGTVAVAALAGTLSIAQPASAATETSAARAGTVTGAANVTGPLGTVAVTARTGAVDTDWTVPGPLCAVTVAALAGGVGQIAAGAAGSVSVASPAGLVSGGANVAGAARGETSRAIPGTVVWGWATSGVPAHETSAAIAGSTRTGTTGVTAGETSAAVAGTVSVGWTVTDPIASSTSRAVPGRVVATGSPIVIGSASGETSAAVAGTVRGNANVGSVPLGAVSVSAPAGSVLGISNVSGATARITVTARVPTIHGTANVAGISTGGTSRAQAGAVRADQIIRGLRVSETSRALAGLVHSNVNLAGGPAGCSSQAVAGIVHSSVGVQGVSTGPVSRAFPGSVTNEVLVVSQVLTAWGIRANRGNQVVTAWAITEQVVTDPLTVEWKVGRPMQASTRYAGAAPWISSQPGG